MSGWIKLHKTLKDWQWYDDHNATRLLVHLLLSVNYKDKEWKGQTIKAGTYVTSWENLAKEIGLSVKQTRVAMDKLERSKEVARHATNKWQAVSLIKWDKLQCEELEKDKQTDKQRATTKESKEIKNIFIPPNFNDILEFCMQNDLDLDANKFINFYESKGWLVGKNKMKNWQAAVRNWATPKQPKEKRYEDMTDGEQIEFNMRKKELEYANKTR
jgi:hypothetical protein